MLSLLIITDHYRVPEGAWPMGIFIQEAVHLEAPAWGGREQPERILTSDLLSPPHHPCTPGQMPDTSARPRGSQGRIAGPPPAGCSSRPLSRLQVAVKMQSIPAILITGRCISQQPVRTKEQQTKNYFSACLQPLPSFPPEAGLQSVAPKP